MDHTKVRVALEQMAVEDLALEEKNGGKIHQWRGSYGGKKFLIKIFINARGTCTIGQSSGEENQCYEILAEAIADHCKVGERVALNLGVANFEAAHQQVFIEFLQSMGAVLKDDGVFNNYRLVRIAGPAGDTLTVKFFTNTTVHLQGRHAQVAVWALDFLRTVLPLDEVLKNQVEVYALPLSPQQIKDHLKVRIPHAHDALVDEVRKQFSSALALTKIEIQLEDFAAVAFPALRGLEGFTLQLLRDECGLAPVAKARLGDYFVINGMLVTMVPAYANGVSADLQTLLSAWYKMWHDQRHRLFHMDGAVETTRILSSRTEAVSIVQDVLNTVEEGYINLQKSKRNP